jgi:hypothetical protein
VIGALIAELQKNYATLDSSSPRPMGSRLRAYAGTREGLSKALAISMPTIEVVKKVSRLSEVSDEVE